MKIELTPMEKKLLLQETLEGVIVTDHFKRLLTSYCKPVNIVFTCGNPYNKEDLPDADCTLIFEKPLPKLAEDEEDQLPPGSVILHEDEKQLLLKETLSGTIETDHFKRVFSQPPVNVVYINDESELEESEETRAIFGLNNPKPRLKH